MTMRQNYLLDPEVTFLNHGSFGATPQPVFEAYQSWQRRLEWQPVQFLVDELPGHLAHARAVLGAYVGAAADDLVFVPNATHALNTVARSLALGEGDEVLTTDHEYGACTNAWRFLSGKQGFTVVGQPFDLPLAAPDAFIEQLWAGVTPRTRVIYLSHITSPTAVQFPVEAICARARAGGILTIIDGAHAPGQIHLDLDALGADFYFGNLHKWLSAPKGAAFLHTRRECQSLIEPLVVGWGWGADRQFTYGSDYVDYLQWLGTDDLSAYLSVPAAIEFQQTHNWTAVRRACHDLLAQAIERINALTGLPPAYADNSLFTQMAIASLPPVADLPGFKKHFYQQFRVEVPFTQWRNRQFIRVSVQGYNTQADIEALLAALRASL
jgi:isopenicillin-N epimerase